MIPLYVSCPARSLTYNSCTCFILCYYISTCNLVLITSAGVHKYAAGTPNILYVHTKLHFYLLNKPAVIAEKKREEGLLYPLSSAVYVFI